MLEFYCPIPTCRRSGEAQLWMKLQLWITDKPHTGSPENITRPGSYFCRTALS
jgi:hypothetical protein